MPISLHAQVKNIFLCCVNTLTCLHWRCFFNCPSQMPLIEKICSYFNQYNLSTLATHQLTFHSYYMWPEVYFLWSTCRTIVILYWTVSVSKTQVTKTEYCAWMHLYRHRWRTEAAAHTKPPVRTQSEAAKLSMYCTSSSILNAQAWGLWYPHLMLRKKANKHTSQNV